MTAEHHIDIAQEAYAPVFLKDYIAPAYSHTHIDLTFSMQGEICILHARSRIEKQRDGNHDLVLDGEYFTCLSIRLNGQTLAPDTDYRIEGSDLIIPDPGEDIVLDVVSEIDVANNTALEGLYKSGDLYCTQCEAEGFRRMTYFIDRPDNLCTFTTRIEADQDQCPTLLSNGNLMDSGTLDHNRHYAVFSDPFPKPCYLFACVAGPLSAVQDSYTARDGREIDLRIYVRPGDEYRCEHVRTESL